MWGPSPVLQMLDAAQTLEGTIHHDGHAGAQRLTFLHAVDKIKNILFSDGYFSAHSFFTVLLKWTWSQKNTKSKVLPSRILLMNEKSNEFNLNQFDSTGNLPSRKFQCECFSPWRKHLVSTEMKKNHLQL